MTTFYRCKYGLIRVNCGCFNGTLDEFEGAVRETHAGNRHEKSLYGRNPHGQGDHDP